MRPEIYLNGRTKAEFVGFRGSERASTFFKWGRDMRYIRRGMKFRRVKSDNSVETAQVLALLHDSFRIPHVRYDVNLRRPSGAGILREGPRILSLSTFAQIYGEREPAALRD